VRVPGLAFGLALAVRPAGLAGLQGQTARRRRAVEAGGDGPDNARRSAFPRWDP
jgi:hypothetical protein